MINEGMGRSLAPGPMCEKAAHPFITPYYLLCTNVPYFCHRDLPPAIAGPVSTLSVQTYE